MPSQTSTVQRYRTITHAISITVTINTNQQTNSLTVFLVLMMCLVVQACRTVLLVLYCLDFCTVSGHLAILHLI